MSNVLAFIDSASYWGWWVLGVMLVVLEVAAPGAVFLWMGIASGVVGIIVYIEPDLAWEHQLLIFAVLSVVSILMARRYFKSRPIETDHPSLNRRGLQYIGRVFTLTDPIVDGQGRLRVDDTFWKIEGTDLEQGEKIIITAVNGAVLMVEAYQVDGRP
ncbi:MAG: Inner membrane protein YbbJ [Alphaproteobacteria bacterium MarineAlpha4_Bin2]|nr:MAG: Inner membrane protein YbbJ [Alphaproteobacteria bacterium MarineAlpha4_Bin2]